MTAILAVVLVAWLEPGTSTQAPDAMATAATERDTAAADGGLSGVVTNVRTKAKIVGASVVLRSSDGTERRTVTGDAGLYRFRELPPSEYTVEVGAGKSTVAKIFRLAPNEKFRSNFSVDPEVFFTRTVRVKSTYSPRPSIDTRICCFGTWRTCRWARVLERKERRDARQRARAERRRARHES